MTAVIEGQDWAGYQSNAPSTAGLGFVFVKATEGSSYVNPKHDAQVAHARAAGLVVGHYHFQRPGSPTAQATFFLAHAKPKAGDILACDWEDSGVSNADKDAFIKAVMKAQPHLQVGLYCNRSYWTTRDRTGFCGSFLWIADPSAPKGQPRVEHPWLFHQYSEAGGVDHNVGNFKDRAALAAWAGGTTPNVEDPMAGMTKQDVADAVWRTDDITAGSTESNKTNKKWIAETYLKGTFENTVKLLAQEAAQTAAITALAKLVGSNVDTAAVVAAVQDAIATAVVHVQVDVTGDEPTTP